MAWSIIKEKSLDQSQTFLGSDLKLKMELDKPDVSRPDWHSRGLTVLHFKHSIDRLGPKNPYESLRGTRKFYFFRALDQSSAVIPV